MATPARSLTKPSPNPSLVNFTTSLLQTLNPQNPNPSNLTSDPPNQFSPHLNPALVIQVIKNQTNPYHALFFFNWASNPNPTNNYTHTHFCYLAITDLLLSRSLFSTTASLLQLSNRLRDFMIGRFITVHSGRNDTRATIDWFHKAKSIENGRCLFSYIAVLGVLVRAGRMNLAVAPNVGTYTVMIKGFCKMGQIENARKLFDEMPCDPNLITFNTMLHGFCANGDFESGRRVLGRMKESKGCLPDTIAYTIFIDGYCKKGEMEEAMKCMSEMEKQGCVPNVFTYSALIHGLCVKGDVGEAKRMIMRIDRNQGIITKTQDHRHCCTTRKLKKGEE